MLGSNILERPLAFEDLDIEMEDPSTRTAIAHTLDTPSPLSVGSEIYLAATFDPHDSNAFRQAVLADSKGFPSTQNLNLTVSLQDIEIQTLVPSNAAHAASSTLIPRNNGPKNGPVPNHVPNSTTNPGPSLAEFHSGMRASEANSRRLPTRQYQHGSVMPFDGLQPSLFSQDLVALCNYALEQANYTSHAIMQNGDKTAYAVAEEVFNQIFPTGNYHLVVSNTRASYLQILGQKALQSKVKGCNTFVTTIKTRVSDFEHALWITHQDHFKQCIQSQVDYEFMALIKDFDVKLAFHTDEKFHHLAQVQAAAQAEAAAQAKALRSRKARGFQYRPRGFQLTSMQVSQIIATVNTPLTPTGGPTFERFPKLPPELRQMILRFAREYRVIIFSMSSLPPEVEGPPEARRPYLKNNPPMIFKNADESYTTVYATNKDMVCFIEPVPGLKTRATDADIGVPQHVIAPYIPSLNGTPQGPVRYAQLLTVIALPVHTAYHYYRSGSHSKGEGNWKKTRLMCPALGKMVFICGGNLPGPRTLLADMEIRKLDELWPEEKNSVDNVIFGYARAHSKGLIQSLVFEQVVFNGNSN